MSAVHHRWATVAGHELFYREAGPADAPTIVLLHGFPAGSHMFRELIPGSPTGTTSSRRTTSGSACPTRRPPTRSATRSTCSPT
nr:hypothetical protein GCM10025730_44730 [Promicromonospora thailandica]